MAIDTPIGFALLGYGRMGRRYASLVDACPEAMLQAIVDDTAPLPDGAAGFRTMDAFLQDPVASEVDIVVIATPNGLHASQACAALEAGKHVLVEKPLALSSREASLVLDAGAANHRQVFAVMQNRYSIPGRWLKTVCDSGALGRIYMVQLNGYWNRDSRYYLPGGWHGSKALDGGPLFTQFSHLVDMLCWLFGDVSDIRSTFGNFAHGGVTDFEDSGIIQFRLTGGGLGVFNFTTAVWDTNMETSLTIMAEKGTVRLGGQYMEQVLYCHVEDPGITRPSGVRIDPQENHKMLITNVVDVLKGRAAPDIDPRDGWKVVHLIEQFYKSR